MFRTRPLQEDIFDSPGKTPGSVVEPRTDFAAACEEMNSFKLPRKRAAEQEVDTVLRAMASISLSRSGSPDACKHKSPRTILNSPHPSLLGQLEAPVSRAQPAVPPDPMEMDPLASPFPVELPARHSCRSHSSAQIMPELATARSPSPTPQASTPPEEKPSSEIMQVQPSLPERRQQSEAPADPSTPEPGVTRIASIGSSSGHADMDGKNSPATVGVALTSHRSPPADKNEVDPTGNDRVHETAACPSEDEDECEPLCYYCEGCTLPPRHKGLCILPAPTKRRTRRAPERLVLSGSTQPSRAMHPDPSPARLEIARKVASADEDVSGLTADGVPVRSTTFPQTAESQPNAAQSTFRSAPTNEGCHAGAYSPLAAEAAIPDRPLTTTAMEVEMLCASAVSEEVCVDADWPIGGLEAAPLMAVEPVEVQVEIIDQPEASPRSSSTRQREADMPSLEREARLCITEQAGELRFRLLRPSAAGKKVHVAQFLALLQLREVICSQLPAMDRAYATQLLFRQDHRSIICLRAGVVLGGITYRPFVHGEPDGGYAELAFCVVSTAAQVQGLGTRLMNRFKAQLVSDGCFNILTYADNSAIGFFKQHGYSSAIGLPDVRWYGRVKQYDHGVMMHCSLDCTMPYARMPHAIRAAREHAMRAWLEDGGLALAIGAEPEVDQQRGTVGDDMVSVSLVREVAGSDAKNSGANGIDAAGLFVGLAIEDAGACLFSLSDGPDFGGGIGARLAPDKHGAASLLPQWAARNLELSRLLLRKARMRTTATPMFYSVLSRMCCRYYSMLSCETVADLHRHGLASYIIAPGELRRGIHRLKAGELDAENSE